MTGKYNIGKVKKLIEINKNLVNFTAEFNIKSISTTEFEIAIVTQDILDNNIQFEYQKSINSFISGNIKADRGEYKNYLMVIKADEECEVFIEINVFELKKQGDLFRGSEGGDNVDIEGYRPSYSAKDGMNSSNTYYFYNIFTKQNILIFLIIVILSCFIYIYYIKNNNQSCDSIENLDSSSGASCSIKTEGGVYDVDRRAASFSEVESEKINTNVGSDKIENTRAVQEPDTTIVLPDPKKDKTLFNQKASFKNVSNKLFESLR